MTYLEQTPVRIHLRRGQGTIGFRIRYFMSGPWPARFDLTSSSPVGQIVVQEWNMESGRPSLIL